MRKIAMSLGAGCIAAACFSMTVRAEAPPPQSCWGAASAAFAQTGEMGEHSSEQLSPRLGLRNLARSLADVGAIPDDSMASLGVFVAGALGLEIEACEH